MHSFTHAHPTTSPAQTTGLILNLGWRYDLMVSVIDILLGGTLGRLRRQALDLVDLHSGAQVLDIGCGTGTLALEAYPRVGATGRVVGIDPAPRQVDRARTRAARRRMTIDFQIGVIEQLPLADRSFDAVLSTWMMHHLPDDLKRLGLAEIARVLKPGGRLVIVDAEHPVRRGDTARLGVGRLGTDGLPALLAEAGFGIVETRQVQLTRLPGLPQAGIVLARTAA
jgi:ubiquinone/menaquinone biosynthesis C-methylase UbiE